MNRIKLIAVFVLGVMAITITFGAVVYHSVSASPSNQQAAATPTSESPTRKIPLDKGHPGNWGSYSDDNLAAALGITVDELSAAKEKAYQSALAQAVDKGLITQAQADEMNTAGDHMQGWLAKNSFDYDTLLAEALGISAEKLQAAYTQAYNASLDQAVTDGTLTQEQADLRKGLYALRADNAFQASMQSAFEAAVAQAVKDGVITQTQADLVLKNASSLGTDSFLYLGGRGDFGGDPKGGRHGGGYLKNVPSGKTDHLDEQTETP